VGRNADMDAAVYRSMRATQLYSDSSPRMTSTTSPPTQT
jgi:hypothetical protein